MLTGREAVAKCGLRRERDRGRKGGGMGRRGREEGKEGGEKRRGGERGRDDEGEERKETWIEGMRDRDTS